MAAANERRGSGEKLSSQSFTPHATLFSAVFNNEIVFPQKKWAIRFSVRDALVESHAWRWMGEAGERRFVPDNTAKQQRTEAFRSRWRRGLVVAPARRRVRWKRLE